MIRFIHGILREVKEDMLVIEAGGLGYGVRIPASVFDKAPKTGEEILLHTYFSVREDSQELFGFWEERDRDFFNYFPFPALALRLPWGFYPV